jgi:hypothetical protein
MTDEPNAPDAASAAAPNAGALTRAERIADIIRSHLRDSPVSRASEAWNHLETKLGAIAEDILKEP